MQALRQMSGGVLIAIISIVLVLGGISLSLAEQTPVPTVASTTTPIIIDTSTPFLFIATETASQIVLQNSSTPEPFTPIPSNTLPPQPMTCLPPKGWIQISVAPGDTINSLAQRYQTTASQLMINNCLSSADIPSGYILYVPYIYATQTPFICQRPAGWVQYIVQRGDNLYRLALSVGMTTVQLQRANCIAYADDIYVGQKIWLPYLPPTATIGSIIFPTITDTNTLPPPATDTLIPPPATDTSVPPTSTTAPTIAPTNTAPQPTATITPFPTKAP